MDVYDYLASNNLIKKEKYYIEKKKKKEIEKKIYKYKVKKSNNDEENYDITITTGLDNYNNLKNNKILDYTDTLEDKEYDYTNYLFNKYNECLKDYTFISDNSNSLKLGGYIRYINLNDELKFGGILIGKIDENDIFKMRLLLKNSTNNIWKISFIHNYIFYKSHKTKNDKFKNLFLKVAKLD